MTVKLRNQLVKAGDINGLISAYESEKESETINPMQIYNNMSFLQREVAIEALKDKGQNLGLSNKDAIAFLFIAAENKNKFRVLGADLYTTSRRRYL